MGLYAGLPELETSSLYRKKYTHIIHQLYADNTSPSRFAVLIVYQCFFNLFTGIWQLDL